MAEQTPEERIAELESKVAEFRENNIALQKQLAERPAPKASDVRAEDASLAEQLREVNEQLNSLKQEREAEQKKLSAAELGSAIRKATKAPFVGDAEADFALWRAQQEGWTVNEHGAAVRLDAEGNVRMNGDGPETLGSWVSGLVKEAGHLVRQPQGVGGADGRGGTGLAKAGVEVIANPSQDWIEANYAKIAAGEVVVQHD